jgi:hypothetical protein
MNKLNTKKFKNLNNLFQLKEKMFSNVKFAKIKFFFNPQQLLEVICQKLILARAHPIKESRRCERKES